jgi:ubiquinone/menaquinone biosynthesis C-methylase UbiE
MLGVDVSPPMLARAAERLPPGAPVKFVRADATTYQFEPAAFDLLFSRRAQIGKSAGRLREKHDAKARLA